MRRWLAAISLAFLSALASSAAFADPIAATRLVGGERSRINLVVMGDGFTQAEMPAYSSVAQTLSDAFLNVEPFKTYRDLFNVYRVDVASAESGITTMVGGVTTQSRNTALGSVLGCNDIDRLLCVNFGQVLAVLNNTPVQTQRMTIILVVANSTIYGGAGGSYASTTMHPAAPLIVLHEVGHSFGFLADEYLDSNICTPSTPDPVAVNSSASSDRATVPWAVWIDAATPVPSEGPSVNVPGVYAGSSYCERFSRPTYASLMRVLNTAFENVNTEALIRRIYTRTGGTADAVSPSWTSRTVNADEVLRFTVLPKRLNGVALPVTWRVNGVVTPATGQQGRELLLAASSLQTGANTVSVAVTDPTPLVRNDPQGVMTFQRTWNVTVGAAAPRSDALVLATLPSGRSVATSATATAYATTINTTPGQLTNCTLEIEAGSGGGLTFTYQRTNPATNLPVGAPNQIFRMNAGEAVSFVFGVADSSANSGRSVPVVSRCTGAGNSEVNLANQFTLSTAAVTPPDLISISATPVTPGVVDLPDGGAFAFFAVAAVNIGSTGMIDVRPVTTGESLPVALTVCETNPASGQCLAPPAPMVRISFGAGETRTFSVFAAAAGPIGFDPGQFRAFLEMRAADSAALGALRGSTSVALRTTF